MGNHLGPLPEASDGPEGQEPLVRAVGGQGELQEVTHLPSLLDICFFNPRFLYMANHLGPFPEASDGPEGPIWAVGGQGEPREVTHLPSLLETCFF